MALCPVAWHLIVEGSIPMNYSTPPIVEECGKRQHDELLSIVGSFFEDLMRRGARNPSILMISPSPEYKLSIDIAGEWREIVARPDLEVALGVGGGIVNLVVETTTRKTVPSEWLAVYALGAYLKNMRPTIILLVTPGEIKGLPLSTQLLKTLDRLRSSPPTGGPQPWMCANCDLRPVCPEPYI